MIGLGSVDISISFVIPALLVIAALFVIPAKAGIQRLRYAETVRIAYDFNHWIPAKAGMAVKCQHRLEYSERN